MSTIVFVDASNEKEGPLLEAAFNEIVGPDSFVTATSAGTRISGCDGIERVFPGELNHEVLAALRVPFPATGYRSLTPKIIDQASLLVFADNDSLRDLDKRAGPFSRYNGELNSKAIGVSAFHWTANAFHTWAAASKLAHNYISVIERWDLLRQNYPAEHSAAMDLRATGEALQTNLVGLLSIIFSNDPIPSHVLADFPQIARFREKMHLESEAASRPTGARTADMDTTLDAHRVVNRAEK